MVAVEAQIRVPGVLGLGFSVVVDADGEGGGAIYYSGRWLGLTARTPRKLGDDRV